MRILLAIAAFAAMVGIAQPAQARDWTIYGGLEAGYGWNSSDATAGALSRSVDTDGFTGGAFVGASTHVNGPWSLGVEGDWKYAGGDGTDAPISLEQNWTASVRARAAYEITPATDIYATAGWSWADVDADIGATSDSQTLSGWTAGVGVEHEYNDRLFTRVEYRYTDYDEEDFAVGPFGWSADLASHEVLVGVGWKFHS
jgi:outer membrane immunogenic protein